MHPNRLALAILAPLILMASAASAQSEPDVQADPPFERHVIYYKSALALSGNPLGLASVSEFGYKLMLFDSDSILLKDTWLALALDPYITPAFARGGALVQFKPLALLQFTAQANAIGFYGNFDHVQSFQSPVDNHSDDEIDRKSAAGEGGATGGTEFIFQALVQAKVGNVAARVNTKAVFMDLDLPNGDTVFYDPVLDIAFPNKGLAFEINSDLIYLTDFGLKAGIRHTAIIAQYETDDFRPGESTKDPNTPVHRLGPLLSYDLTDGPISDNLNTPSAFMLLHWYLSHRFRAGQESSQLIPFVAVGMAVNGTLF